MAVPSLQENQPERLQVQTFSTFPGSLSAFVQHSSCLVAFFYCLQFVYLSASRNSFTTCITIANILGPTVHFI